MNKVTREKVSDLLKGYRREYPILISAIDEELSKANPLNNVMDMLEEQVNLYDLLYRSVMLMESERRSVLLYFFLSQNQVSYSDVAKAFNISTAGLGRRIMKAKDELTLIMNKEICDISE